METLVIMILVSIFFGLVYDVRRAHDYSMKNDKRRKLFEIINAHPIEQEFLLQKYFSEYKNMSHDDIFLILFEISKILRKKNTEQSLPKIHQYLFWELSKYKKLSIDECNLIHSWYRDILHTEHVYKLVDLIQMNIKKTVVDFKDINALQEF